jgi:glyoxylate reductase
MKIAVTRRLFEDQIGRLRAVSDIRQWDSDLPPQPDELVSLLVGVDGALILLTDRIDAKLLDANPGLRVVSNLAVGFDNIDVRAATERGVAVCTTPDVLTNATAEFTLALLFAAARCVLTGDRFARAGEWATWYPMRFLGLELQGATLGVIGLGRIGMRVAELASALGMRVIYSDPCNRDPRYELTQLEDLLRRAEVVSIHAPLTKKTRRLLDGNRLRLMRDDAILINTARGAIIDTEALVAELDAGRFSAVALDVTDPEPLPPEHALYGFERVIVTPHIASATVTTRKEMARLAVDNLLAVLSGAEPPHCLNPEVLNRD